MYCYPVMGCYHAGPELLRVGLLVIPPSGQAQRGQIACVR